MVELIIARNGGGGASKIDISSATVTLTSDTLTYDGTLKTQGVANVVVNGLTLVENTDYTVMNNAYTNAGNYTLVITGMGGYKGTKSVDWSIAKAQGSVVVNPTTLTIIGAGESDTVSVSYTGDGALSVGSSDSSVATASISGTTVTITSVADGNATITVMLGTGDNYLGSSASVSVTAIVISSVLAECTPAQIQLAAQKGIASSLWSIGDVTAPISIGAFSNIVATNNICAFIIGFNHNSSLEGSGIHFQFGKITDGTDVAFYGLKMNNANTNNKGWNNSYIRTIHCAAFLSALPSAWQNVIASTIKYSDNTGYGSDTASYVTSTSDKIFLLSEWEVFGARSYANSAEQNYQNQYIYYANGNSKIKYHQSHTNEEVSWWTRSVYVLNTGRFCCVSTNGSAGYSDANISNGFAPAFMIG